MSWYFIFPSAVWQRGHNSNLLKNIFPQCILCNTLEIKVYLHMYADFQLQSLLCFDKLHFCVVPISPYKGIICFLPLAGAGSHTGIYNDTRWWKQGENTGADLFCSVSVMSLLALDLVAHICLMKHGCFNLRDCPSPRSISSLLEIESWLSNVPVIIVIKTVPPQQRPQQRVIW